MALQVGEAGAAESNFENRAATATTSDASTTFLGLKPNGNDKENGSRNGYNGTEKTTLNQVHSGPKDWEHLRSH